MTSIEKQLSLEYISHETLLKRDDRQQGSLTQKLKKSWGGGCSCSAMANVLEWGHIVCEFELQSRYFVPLATNTFGKDLNSHIPPAMG